MAKKHKSNEPNPSVKYLIGIIVLGFLAVGAYLYFTSEEVVPIKITKTTGVGTEVTPTPVRLATPPPTPTTTPPPTPTPTPRVTEATPTPLPTTVTQTPRASITSTAVSTPTEGGTIVYQSVQWGLSAGGTSTAEITFRITGTWVGTIKAQVKKDVFGTDPVIGETDQYVSGTSTLETVTVTFPWAGQTANAGDWVFIRVEGIYDVGGIGGILGGTTERTLAGTEVRMPSVAIGGGGGGAR